MKKTDNGYEDLPSLTPRAWFHWFGEVSKIPRTTGNEARFIIFLQKYANIHRLHCETDESGNVYMRVPATTGYEAEPPLLLQAHMDIVGVKEDWAKFDFANDPIRLYVDDSKLLAQGTTLGADNGVGLATMLALGDDIDIPHPELEFLFTVEEESGLMGIRDFDMSRIHSRRMINMDCGDSHVICISSAGRISGKVRWQYATEPIPEDWAHIRLDISGGLGGHSGLMINKGRACAGNLMGELLNSGGVLPRLCSINTSNKPILRECSVVIALPKKDIEVANIAITKKFKEISSNYTLTDPGLKLAIQPCARISEGLDEDNSARITRLLALLHTGPYYSDVENRSIVMTSSALGEVLLEKGLLQANFTIRSLSNEEKVMLFSKYKTSMELLDVEMKEWDRIPSWSTLPNSAMQSMFCAVHKQLFGMELELEQLQGCVEMSFICEAIPDMDAIGIAPTARGAHTTQECLYINEVAPFWELMKAVLAKTSKPLATDVT